MYQKNFHYFSKFQKRANSKNVKLKSYAFVDKIWINYKYFKIKKNQRLKFIFFGSFLIFYSVEKWVYKIQFSKKLKIYNVFYMSLLEQNTTKKK